MNRLPLFKETYIRKETSQQRKVETAVQVFAPQSNTIIGILSKLGPSIILLEHPSHDIRLCLGPDLLSPQTASEASRPLVIVEEVQSSKGPRAMPVFGFLKELPNRTIPHNTANNLTQVSYMRSNKYTQT